MLHLMRKVEITDEHWRRLEPLLPPLRKGRGRPRADDRKTLNGILYVLRTEVAGETSPASTAFPQLAGAA